MARGTIFPLLRRHLRTPSISAECGGSSFHCKAQAFPLKLFSLVLLVTDRSGFQNSVPVMFIYCAEIPEEGTVTPPACCCLLFDLALTDTAGITEWSFEIFYAQEHNEIVVFSEELLYRECNYAFYRRAICIPHKAHVYMWELCGFAVIIRAYW